ncbi:MAG: AI-2E family transporter [Clostridiales Family XIII bacterium]|jgi:predicted PurR-regulated permease PerM|nr:AI-2E family transporter [Clostridiales Family XIII bacterium]
MDKTKLTVKNIAWLIVLAAVLLLIVLNFTKALGVIGYLTGLVMPLIIGICMAFILNVLMRFIEHKVLSRIPAGTGTGSGAGSVAGTRGARIWRNLKRPVSLVITIVIVAGIITLVLVMIIPSLKETVTTLIKEAPGFGRRVIEWSNNFLSGIGVSDDVETFFSKNWEDIVKRVISFLSGAGSATAKNAIDVTVGVFSGFSNFIFGFVFALYILLTKERLKRQSSKLMNAWLPKRAAQTSLRVLRRASKVFGRFVSGQCIEAVIIGVLTFTGSLFINSHYAVMLGVLVGFTALIPVIGAFIGIIVGALLLLMASPWQALAFVVFIIVLQQLENHLIYPRVVGKSIGLPGMWVLLAVLAGGSLNGIAGIIIGVPLSALLYSLLREMTNNKLKGKTELIE